MKYKYRCPECWIEPEIVQSIKDDPIKECPECGSPFFHRVIGKVPAYGSRKHEGQK